MKSLHTDDIVAGDGQVMRRQMIENFKAIEQAINDLQGQIDKMKKQDQEDKDFLNELYK